MNEELRNEIVRRWRGAQSCRGIARDLQITRGVVERVLRQHQQQRGDAAPTVPRARKEGLLAAHEEAMCALLARYPDIAAMRLLEELRKLGYRGGYTTLRQRLRELRPPRRREFVERFETSPGVQAQMDYAVYDLEFTHEGRRRVNLFSYVLGYSRRQYLRFVPAQDMETTLRQHVRAFEHLGGVAAICLYDNMKVVVARYEDGEPLYNTRFLAFATHYGFRPVACRPRRAQTKGKVERPFHYVETSLLNGRTFRSLEHLNEVTAWWLAEVADVRVHRQTGQRPIDRHAAERVHLIPLPPAPYEVGEVVYRTVDVEGFISYAKNRYSVPWDKTHPGAVLPVKISEDEIIIYSQKLDELARHPRFGTNMTQQQSQLRAHRPPRDLQQRRTQLRQQFAQLGTPAVEFLEGLLKTQRCGWEHAQRVLALLGTYRRPDVLAALERASRFGAFAASSVERILAVQAHPKTALEHLADQHRPQLGPSLTDTPAPPRPPADYQQLWFEESTNEQVNAHEQPRLADEQTGPADEPPPPGCDEAGDSTPRQD
jgi:transposase